MKKILLLALFAPFFFACKKDTNGGQSGGFSLANTEFVGTALVGNHYFPRPLSIRFGDNNTVSAWSHLVLSQYHRETKGIVTRIETDGQGQHLVTVAYDLPGEEQFNSPQTYTISADNSTISGGTNPLFVMSGMKSYPKTAPSVVGSWAQPDHPQWYLDVNAISFLTQGTTLYTQAGKVVWFSYDSGVRWQDKYKQDGSRITFAGVNIDTEPGHIHSIAYYGVISADGKTLYMDAYDFSIARLPNPFSSFEWNGPKGITPSLLKQ